MIENDVPSVTVAVPTMRAVFKARLPRAHKRARSLRLGVDRLRKRISSPEDKVDRRAELAALARDLTNSQVVYGPFQGLRYISASGGSEYAPKLLGTYEMELFPTWEGILLAGYHKLVNVGMGEGYYAVGFTRIIPGIRVIGFEAQPAFRAMAVELARLNAASQAIELNGICNAADLRTALAGEPKQLLLCDAEGAEDALLRPNDIPALGGTDILVETHDFVRPGITAELVRRFRSTHSIDIVPSRPRELSDWPAVLRSSLATDDERLALMSEARPAPMAWLWLQSLESDR